MDTTINNEIIEVAGVRGFIDSEGTIWLKLHDVAIGLGFTKSEVKNGKAYTQIRWARVRAYLADIDFRPLVVENPNAASIPNFTTMSNQQLKDAFIPEQVSYKLAMKANNAIANAFQDKVAYEILPAIRKHGAYMTPATLEKAILNPDFIIRLAQMLKDEQAKNAALTQTIQTQQAENVALTQAIQTLEPKANYCDIILNCPDTVTTTIIAKDYGMSARAFNELLAKFKIQFKQSGMWMLYAPFAGKGYTQSKTINVTDHSGRSHARTHTTWTQRGRMFLYNFLRKRDIYPTIERLSF